MGWNTRGTKRYLYRSFRDGNGVHRQYLGSGEKAMAYLAHVQKKGSEELQTRNTLARLQRTQAAFDAQTYDLDTAIRDLMEGEFLVAGFHLHAGSVWRRRREVIV